MWLKSGKNRRSSINTVCSVKSISNADLSTVLELWGGITLSRLIRSPWLFDYFSSAFNALSEWFFNFDLIWTSCFTWSEPSWPQCNGLYFGSYQELACPTLIHFLNADVIWRDSGFKKVYFKTMKQWNFSKKSQIIRKCWLQINFTFLYTVWHL